MILGLKRLNRLPLSGTLGTPRPTGRSSSHVRNCRSRRGAQRRGYLIEGLRASSIAVTTPRASRCWSDHRLARMRAAARCGCSRGARSRRPSRVMSASHTPAGRPMAPDHSNAHPHVSATASRSCITASSRTTRRFARVSSTWAINSTRTPTLKSSRIGSTITSPDAAASRAVRKSVSELRRRLCPGGDVGERSRFLVLAREGCPLVLGLGIDENFVASDVPALCRSRGGLCSSRKATSPRYAARRLRIFDLRRQAGGASRARERPFRPMRSRAGPTGTSCSRRSTNSRVPSPTPSMSESPAARLLDAAFGPNARDVFRKVKAVHIVACGTSYHAGLIAGLLDRADLPHAGAARDRERISLPRSGDHPGHAVRHAVPIRRNRRYAGRAAQCPSRRNYVSTLSICNVPESSMVRESDLVLMTRAGPEIGVASTKAFTTQLSALGHAHRRSRETAPGRAAAERDLEGAAAASCRGSWRRPSAR